MNLQDLKLSSFGPRVQVIVFDESGQVIESDQTLFRCDPATSNVFRDIILFQGMEEVIRGIGTDELKFNCITLDLYGYESQFDFVLRLVDPDAKIYSLLVFDFAEQYQRVFELQQERNLRDIEAKKLERENRRILEENEVINRLYDQMRTSDTSEYVLLRADNLWVNVDLNTVNYFEAYGDYIKVYAEAKMYIIHNRMKALEKQLPKGKFVRVHRSFIVQKNKIKNIEQMSLNVAEKVIPIGKQYKHELLDQMNQL